MDDNRLTTLLLHVNAVQENCLLLGNKLIESGEQDFGIQLIANGRIHDYSKFSGIEFEYLNDNKWPYPDDDPRKPLFLEALRHHTKTNPHHIEYWLSYRNMPKLFIYEMVADWKARSSEQGTDLREWIKNVASTRYKFSLKSIFYKEILKSVNLLLVPKFQ